MRRSCSHQTQKLPFDAEKPNSGRGGERFHLPFHHLTLTKTPFQPLTVGTPGLREEGRKGRNLTRTSQNSHVS